MFSGISNQGHSLILSILLILTPYIFPAEKHK
jgi:hypothetical protein